MVQAPGEHCFSFDLLSLFQDLLCALVGDVRLENPKQRLSANLQISNYRSTLVAIVAVGHSPPTIALWVSCGRVEVDLERPLNG